MEYCRKLKFTEDPDYNYIIKLFEGCMTRNGFDPKLMDYTWKQNRLSQQKRELIEQVKNAIHKKKDAKKVDPTSAQMKQANQILKGRKDEDPGEKAKRDAAERAEFKKQMMRK